MHSRKDNAIHLQASLASLGDPGGAFRTDSYEREPGRGVKAREGTVAWTMLVQMDEYFKLVHGQDSTMQTALPCGGR